MVACNTLSIMKEYSFKVLMVGDVGTGKTSIIKRFVHDVFTPSHNCTIGVDFALKLLHVHPDALVRLQLWDIAGQERFSNMTRVYYKDALGAFVVFDVSRLSTFDGVSKWKTDIDIKIPPSHILGSIPVILLANKVDLESKVFSRDLKSQMDTFCREKGFVAWYETSAKETMNLDKACRFLVDRMIDARCHVVESMMDYGSGGGGGRGSVSLSLKEHANKSCCFCYDFIV